MAFPFRAVIFDMDGLTIDTEAVFRTIWQESAKDLGHAISDELFESFIGSRDVDCEARLKTLWGDYPVETFRERRELRWNQYAAQNIVPRKAGLMELLDYLDSIGIRKAIATSSRRESADAKLGDLAKRFDALVTGDEIARGKPAPDIFLLAAQRLDFLPSDCLVLEDSHAGIQAAVAAGMYAIMVPDLLPPNGQAAHVCQSLHEVQSWIQAQMESGVTRVTEAY